MAKITLKRINVFSVAKWHGVTGLISGVLLGVVDLGIALYNSRQNAFYYGVYYLIGFPLIYLFITFFGSIIGGGIYNLFSDSFGGMKFEIETDDKEMNLPPSPPENWS